MTYRYYVDPLEQPGLSPGTEVELSDPESHHLIHVMRQAVGDSVQVFDGQGHLYDATVARISRKQAWIRLDFEVPADAERPCDLTVGVPLPKGDRQKFLVEKLTELGVARLVLLETSRSTVKGTEKNLRKLERVVIEACKQCRRNELMRIAGPVPVQQIDACLSDGAKSNAAETGTHKPVRKLFAHPECHDARVSNPSRDTVLLVGPEGGFSSEEVEFLLRDGWQPIGLGNTILRMETAAIAGSAAILFGSL